MTGKDWSSVHALRLVACALVATACSGSGQDGTNEASESAGSGGSTIGSGMSRAGIGNSTTPSRDGGNSGRGASGGDDKSGNVGGSSHSSGGDSTLAITGGSSYANSHVSSNAGASPSESTTGGLGHGTVATSGAGGDVTAGGASQIGVAHSGGGTDVVAAQSGGTSAVAPSIGGASGASTFHSSDSDGGAHSAGANGAATGGLGGRNLGGASSTVAIGSAGTAGASLIMARGGGESGAAGSAMAGAAFAWAGSTNVPVTMPQIPPEPIATIETDSFAPSGSTTDIADDSAIYANPTSPELSVIVADNKDDKKGGVGVFDMQGKLLEFRQDGMIGNIDLRGEFPFNGESIVLVGANNRTNNTLIFWRLDPATRHLSEPIGNATATIVPSYGFCLYHSSVSGLFYAFVTQLPRTASSSVTMQQFELGVDAAGKVSGTLVRSFDLASITEGCVADDELGWLYVAQEDVALWRYGAEPDAGSSRTQVGAVGDGHLVADLEGLAIAKGPGNSGYLVVSAQGDSRFVTFDRVTNAYLGGFTVGANGSIDGVTQTDGLDISTSNLGPGFEHGALVVHDGENTDGITSNLKYVALQ